MYFVFKISKIAMARSLYSTDTDGVVRGRNILLLMKRNRISILYIQSKK
jgi:hypothetical protein